MLYKLTSVYSYWIFIWFIIYYFNIISIYNPIFILIVAYIITFLQVFYLYFYNTTINNILHFIKINICIKFIPIMLLILRKDYIISIADIIFSIFITIIYTGYSFLILNKNPINIYKKLLDAYIYNHPNKSNIYKIFNKFYDQIKFYHKNKFDHKKNDFLLILT